MPPDRVRVCGYWALTRASFLSIRYHKFAWGNLFSIALKSYLDLGKDEEEHALALHGENVVIDASLVAFIDYVGEDIWVDDVLKGGLTASNATVCMGRSFNGALTELGEHHDWAEKNEKALIARKASDIEKAKKEGRHAIILGPQDSSFL